MSLAFCFAEAGKAYGINPSLLKSIAKVESNLNPKAINKNLNGSIDIGVMQVNSSWISTLGLDGDKLISDPCYNVMTGTKILKNCIDRHGYTWEAVGCYNAVSKYKRVNYSWKIYNKLKAEGFRVRSEKTANNNLTHPPITTWSKSESSLSFSMRDNASIE